MMRCIIDEAERWRGSNPELVLPDAAEVAATSEMEGIASAAVHAAHSLSKWCGRSLSRTVSKSRRWLCFPRTSGFNSLSGCLILSRSLRRVVVFAPMLHSVQPE